MKYPHLTDCPQPGCKGKVRRKIGRGAGIIFKGSGFYQTDYRSDSYKAAAKKDSEDSSAPAAPKESSAPKESDFQLRRRIVFDFVLQHGSPAKTSS